MVTNHKWASAALRTWSSRRAVEPIQECRHFTADAGGGNRFEENALLPDRPGDDLPSAVAPGAESDSDPAARAGRKEGGMPVEQTFLGERLVVVPGGVEHHFDDPFNGDPPATRPPMSIPRRRAIDDLTCSASSLFPFDLAALEDVGSQCLEHRLLPKAETESLHMPRQTPVAVPQAGKLIREKLTFPLEPGPVLKFVDIHSPLQLRRL